MNPGPNTRWCERCSQHIMEGTARLEWRSPDGQPATFDEMELTKRCFQCGGATIQTTATDLAKPFNETDRKETT